MATVQKLNPIADLRSVLYEFISPIEKYIRLKKIMEEVPQDLVYPILDLDIWQPRHQTLTVFQVCQDATYSWQERSLRMASGFNTAETIKVDIMSLSDGDFYEGLVFTGKHPGGLPYEAIRDQAARWGYNQMFLHTYTGKNQ